MKLIHISDLHYPDTGDRTEILIDKIIAHYQGSVEKPLIILTGDIVDSSLRKVHFQEAQNLLKRLIHEGFNMLLCPGNHDLKAEGIGPIVNGRRRFDNYFRTLLPPNANFYGEADNNLYDFPIVHQFDHHYYIGLDSQAAEGILGATGECGSEQLKELEGILEDIRSKDDQAIITVYLHHHPLKFAYRPEFLKLKDKDELLQIISGIDILLFGHLHFNERFPEDELKYNISCILLSGDCTHGSRIGWREIDAKTFEDELISFLVK